VNYPEYFPNITFLRVNFDASTTKVYTLISNRGYKAHNMVFFEKLNRDHDYDSLSMYNGFIGAYPNLFLEISPDQINGFADDIKKIDDNTSWMKFLSRYAVARNSCRFWPHFDWIHEYKLSGESDIDPVNQGIVDLSQYMYFEE